ncbi:MAG: SH3 domain-containing protein [Kiritimatiellaceae bacterium]|nr:SH3 domain-containing protein [Kiritimatiellaceae bacterium]
MNKHWIAGIILFLAGLATANEPVHVKVTGNRVNLREAPQLNALLLGQAMSGDLLTLVDSSHKEWFGVVPPETVPLWVSGEYIQNNNVIPELLNVRSGPSFKHGVVGILHRDDRVIIRGKKDGWLQIAPTARTTVWVSRKYSEIIGAVGEPTPVIHIKAAPEPKAAIVQSTPKKNAVTEFAKKETDLSCSLTLNPNKPQGEKKHLTGILKKSGEKLFKLVDINANNHTLCYVRGNLKQMNSMKGKPVAITGESFWVASMNVPIVKPVKIQLLKP